MCGVSGLELVIILAVALIVLGPDKLPDVLRFLGGVMREVRRVTGEVGRLRSDLTQSPQVEELRRQIRAELQMERTRPGRADELAAVDAIKAARQAVPPTPVPAEPEPGLPPTDSPDGGGP